VYNQRTKLTTKSSGEKRISEL